VIISADPDAGVRWAQAQAYLGLPIGVASACCFSANPDVKAWVGFSGAFVSGRRRDDASAQRSRRVAALLTGPFSAFCCKNPAIESAERVESGRAHHEDRIGEACRRHRFAWRHAFAAKSGAGFCFRKAFPRGPCAIVDSLSQGSVTMCSRRIIAQKMRRQVERLDHRRIQIRRHGSIAAGGSRARSTRRLTWAVGTDVFYLQPR